ncbi:Lrp/AsnC family transcriptional regulator [Pseudodonghicola flavimaris]|uniref:Lrp/AsnC family transcriptional regulator n=1 Tax=Pseudodonghicola flavimaris TaxID=3050036 RepID=A0ABT7F3Q3_9RHOB|nr:Lrp/AsnC family transcriptional regulator [Pseudodonghicola flavimaris]MDK3019233.1 Lrp/AsnC family transcriptional regulator [Pseudodonghicola flavimaris]
MSSDTTDIRLDRIDRRILQQLMRDASLPVARLAERVGLSQTPCWKRVQKLEAAGIILGRVARVAPKPVGIGLIAFVEIEAQDHSDSWRAAFRETVARFDAIVESYRMVGRTDYLLKVAVADTDAFDAFYLQFTRALPCRNVTSKFAMETLHATTAWPIDVETP